jgi:hypothetical protein
MARVRDSGAADEWQELMADWDSALAEYEAARKVHPASATDADARFAAARVRLDELQEKISVLVKRGASGRNRTGETFIEAAIAPGTAAARSEAIRKTKSIK